MVITGASRVHIVAQRPSAVFAINSLAMQATAKVPGQQAPVKIYNAVYSSVQVNPSPQL
jgi:hypothetical protein